MAYVSMSDLAQVSADQRAEQIKALETNAAALEKNADAIASAQPATALALRASAAAMRKTLEGLRGQPASEPSMASKLMEVAKSPVGLAVGAAALLGGGYAWWRSRQV